jgi:hypothetical protein
MSRSRNWRHAAAVAAVTLTFMVHLDDGASRIDVWILAGN